MVDPTPAVATWTITAQTCTGDPVKNIKATLTEGDLSLASLGEVPLPAEQLIMDGKLYTQRLLAGAERRASTSSRSNRSSMPRASAT